MASENKVDGLDAASELVTVFWNCDLIWKAALFLFRNKPFLLNVEQSEETSEKWRRVSEGQSTFFSIWLGHMFVPRFCCSVYKGLIGG